jgi:hypothetical protein
MCMVRRELGSDMCVAGWLEGSLACSQYIMPCYRAQQLSYAQSYMRDFKGAVCLRCWRCVRSRLQQQQLSTSHSALAMLWLPSEYRRCARQWWIC